MKLIYLLVSTIFFFTACEPKRVSIGDVQALVPIYEAKATATVINQMQAQPIINGGKIATLGQYLFQVEDGKGIHIINKSNPANPVKVSFIKIPLCHELTLKGNFLYTNNLADLVVLDISNLGNITVASRLENAFPDLNIQYPDTTGVYFVCPDPSKGVITGWEIQTVNNPKCRR